MDVKTEVLVSGQKCSRARVTIVELSQHFNIFFDSPFKTLDMLRDMII